MIITYDIITFIDNPVIPWPPNSNQTLNLKTAVSLLYIIPDRLIVQETQIFIFMEVSVVLSPAESSAVINISTHSSHTHTQTQLVSS